MPEKQSLADRISADVQYRGVNAHKKHMFCNGTAPLVSDVFDTLEQGVTRFGKRIKIDDAALKYSAAYNKGLGDAKHEPRDGAGSEEQYEYGSGRLVRLLEALPERHPLWPNGPAMRS